MAVVYTGAFTGLTNWPPDHTGQGWSNFVQNATTPHTRYADGDFVASAIWREMFGNVNFHVAESRRGVWEDSWISPTGADPTYGHSVINNAFNDLDAVYATTCPMILIPDVALPESRRPKLIGRVRAKQTSGANANPTFVRLYSADGLYVLRDWPLWEPTLPYAEWTISSTSYPSGGSPDGWSAEDSVIPVVTETSYTHPETNANEGDIEIDMPTTVLILCGSYNGTGELEEPSPRGTVIAQIQVWEDVIAS